MTYVYRFEICLNVNQTMNAETIIPMYTTPKTFVYHNPHITRDITIVTSNPIFIYYCNWFNPSFTWKRCNVCREVYEYSESYEEYAYCQKDYHNTDPSNGMNDTIYMPNQWNIRTNMLNLVFIEMSPYKKLKLMNKKRNKGKNNPYWNLLSAIVWNNAE